MKNSLGTALSKKKDDAPPPNESSQKESSQMASSQKESKPKNAENRSKWSRLLRPEMLVAFSAIIISLSALAVSLYETSLIRQQQHASVWPHVMVGPSIQSERFMFLVSNTGIGPARIKDVEVTVDDEPVRNWVSMLEVITDDSGPFNFSMSMINGRVLSAGESYEIFWMVDGSEGDDENFVRQLSDDWERIDITVCYCSVYDDCWTVQMSENNPQATEIDECVHEEGRSFEM